MRRVCILISFVLFLGSSKAFASLYSIFTVINLNDAGPGSLRQAIIDANNQPGRDSIFFQQGLEGYILLSGSLPPVTEAVFISGSGAQKISISGNNLFRIFEINIPAGGQRAIIEGLTLRNGNGNIGGALINNGRSTITIRRCIIKDCSSPLTGSGVGGGFSNGPFAEMEIDNCIFRNNEAYSFGGAMYNLGRLNITNSSFIANVSYKGAAIFNIRNTGITSLINCTFSGNTTTGGSGAAIYADLQSSMQINHCSITDNEATGVGSGGGISITSASVNIFSSSSAGNNAAVSGPDIAGTLISGGYNLLGNNSGCIGITHSVNNDLAGNNNALLDPLLSPISDNGGFTPTHALLPGSPAIDAGSCDGSFTDQRGVSRPAGNQCDIGSYEFSNASKVDLGPLTVFLGAHIPADNGKKVDIKAELMIQDQLIAQVILPAIQIAGHMNSPGIRFDLPLQADDVSVRPGDEIKLKISVRQSGKHAMNVRLWHNADSINPRSRGFSRIVFKEENNLPGFLFLSEALQLTLQPGQVNTFTTANSGPDFNHLGTWIFKYDRTNTAARPLTYTKKEIPEFETNFQIDPNPASDRIRISFNATENCSARAEIINLQGKACHSASVNKAKGKQQIILNTTSLPSGIYSCRLTLSNHNGLILQKSRQFIISR